MKKDKELAYNTSCHVEVGHVYQMQDGKRFCIESACKEDMDQNGRYFIKADIKWKLDGFHSRCLIDERGTVIERGLISEAQIEVEKLHYNQNMKITQPILDKIGTHNTVFVPVEKQRIMSLTLKIVSR